MTRDRRPPRWAHGLLRRFVPADARDTVLGDLQEVFHERIRTEGPLRARAWYGLEALSFSFRFALERALEAIGSLHRGLAPSWLDFRLGARMLVKTPLLTVTGCVAIATAIAINAGAREFMRQMFHAASLVDLDDRIVRLANRDLESGSRDPRVLEDLTRWRQGLETVEDIGASVSLDMSLIDPDGHATKVNVSEMSASGFRVGGTVPELGRPLLDSDDGPGAEPVVVLGRRLWERVLGADPDIVGTVLTLGQESYRVVGVAPDDFRFPSSADAWTNFRLDPRSYPPRAGPSVVAFGRLAPGRTLTQAQQEIERLGATAAADDPAGHGRLRSEVERFSDSFGIGSSQVRWVLRIARTLLVMLLIVACANVATLVFARNAGRESEITIRHALGAGRSRIVMQMFAEALVLALLSAGLGLVAVDRALRFGGRVLWEVQRTDPPFWWDLRLTSSTVLYSLVLAALGAVVIGVLPALRATGRRAHAALQRAGSGKGALTFGRLPTAVIVLQIGITVAFIPIVLTGMVDDFRDRFISVSFPTEHYLTARLLVDSEVEITSTAEDEAAGATGARTIQVASVTDHFRVGPALLSRYREMRERVAERLRRQPGVRRVAFTSRLPGLLGESIPASTLELEGGPPRDGGWRVRTATADPGLFDVVGDTVLDGRSFTIADYAPRRHVAVVNQAFVDEVFRGQSPVGRLVRDVRPAGDEERPWTEIVGVVPDEVSGPAATQAQIYYPLAGLGEYPMRMLIEVDGDPAAFAPRLRSWVGASEPGLILDEVHPLVELRHSEVLADLFWVVVLSFVALVTALLATTGVYALMSFVVSRRTREIGIRTALGADPVRVVRGVFRRTFLQLGLGVALGLGVVGLLGVRSLGRDGGRTLWLAGCGVAAVIVVVGLVGCAIPVARALRIQPIRALGADV